MRSGKAAEANTDVKARIAQIEQMTLDQIADRDVSGRDTGRSSHGKNCAKRS